MTTAYVVKEKSIALQYTCEVSCGGKNIPVGWGGGVVTFVVEKTVDPGMLKTLEGDISDSILT